MMNALIGLGYGIIVFAILIGAGSLILISFAGSTANCASLASCGAAGVWNSTAGQCSNATSSTCGAPTTTSYTNTNYMLGQLGSSGLAGWTPAIIAIAVGLLFLGAFMVRGGKKKEGRY